jgi:uncharacterized repeat protein (TIGR01451 family)
MNGLTPRTRVGALSIVAVTLLALIATLVPARAQGSLTLSFALDNYMVQTINPTTDVDYSDNITMTPANAKLTCTPAIGSEFARGATKVACSASANGQIRQGNFYVLVANDDDTDVTLYDITQDPAPAEPATTVAYNIEYRTTVEVPANQVVITGTLPPELIYVSVSNPNCDVSELPKITCVTFTLSPAQPLSFVVRAKVKPGFKGSFKFPWTVSLQSGQRDLRADNNSLSATTEVRVSQAPNKIYLPMLAQR